MCLGRSNQYKWPSYAVIVYRLLLSFVSFRLGLPSVRFLVDSHTLSPMLKSSSRRVLLAEQAFLS
jgi:hypothetical protein